MGLDVRTTSDVTGVLRDAGYIDGMEFDHLPGLTFVTRLTPDGRREVGLWPSPDVAADRLVAALQAAVDDAPEGPKKTKRQRVMDAVVGMGREFIVGVATNMASGG